MRDERVMKPRVEHCEFCWHDDQDELKKCYACSRFVCANPVCRIPHDKEKPTCSSNESEQRKKFKPGRQGVRSRRG
jgi:hypothetical protein